MAEYIDKTALLEKVIIPSIASVLVSGNEAKRIKKFCIDTVKAVPSADVAPVNHGKWSSGKGERGTPYAHCSACNQKMSFWCYGYAYCALCGARMDGER